MSLAVLGVGTAVPPTSMNQEESVTFLQNLAQGSDKQAAWLAELVRHSGIHRRHAVWETQAVRDVLDGSRLSGSAYLPNPQVEPAGPTTQRRMADYQKHAGALALQAARRSLERAELRAPQITDLVTVSCTGFSAPGWDCELIELLGLDRQISRTHVGFMGCHGALNGLRVARALDQAEPAARILLCAVELCSVHGFYGFDRQKIIANVLFADGAAAVVASAQGRSHGWNLLACGSCVFPDSADAMTWTIGDHGFVMTLSKRVPALIGENLRPWLTGWLERHGVKLGDIASWAIHPGGPKILAAIKESLDLSPRDIAPSCNVLHHFGNMSSPTILFILDELRRLRAPLPCLALAFGPGLAVEAALFGNS